MMKMRKQIFLIITCLLMALTSIFIPVQAGTTVTGDIKTDPIILKQKQKLSTCISKDGNVKYFRLLVTETGNVTVTISSDKLKKNGTIALFYDEGGVCFDQTAIKYDKKTKTAKASLQSSKILSPGQYDIVVTTDRVSKDTKFMISTSINKYVCDDVESNNKEELAQPMTVKDKKSAVSYNMLLSGESFAQDMIDYFYFDLKTANRIKITATAKGTDRIRVLLKKKTDTGSEVVNNKESEQYFSFKNGKYVFSYSNKQKLPKGSYYIMVWLDDSQTLQSPYTIETILLK